MVKLWAIWVMNAESICHAEGTGLPIPLDLIDAAVAAAPELAEHDYGWVPSVSNALDRLKKG